MMEKEIIEALKKHYSRDLRKQIVKSMLKSEKSNDKAMQESSYRVINQIFSYIISELGWSISENTDGWDETPLKIIRDTFPKIDTTKWFKEQQLNVKNSIDLKGDIN